MNLRLHPSDTSTAQRNRLRKYPFSDVAIHRRPCQTCYFNNRFQSNYTHDQLLRFVHRIWEAGKELLPINGLKSDLLLIPIACRSMSSNKQAKAITILFRDILLAGRFLICRLITVSFFHDAPPARHPCRSIINSDRPTANLPVYLPGPKLGRINSPAQLRVQPALSR